jgi:hypothetical protein
MQRDTQRSRHELEKVLKPAVLLTRPYCEVAMSSVVAFTGATGAAEEPQETERVGNSADCGRVS